MSGVTPSKARAPSNTDDPSQAACVRGPMMDTLPSCQSPSRKVQVFEKAAIRGSSERQRVARERRPGVEIETVGREERQGQTVDAEGDAARMGKLSVIGPQVPDLAEVVAVI